MLATPKAYLMKTLLNAILLFPLLTILSVAGGPLHAQTFQNPLLPAGADPWSVYHDGYYYYMHTTGRDLNIWKTKDLAQLPETKRMTVWTPPATGPYSKNIWAPELKPPPPPHNAGISPFCSRVGCVWFR